MDRPFRRNFLVGIAGACVILAGAGGWLLARGQDNQLAIGGPFALKGTDGKTVTDTDLRGKFLLIYFGYTNCPDVCPTTLSDMVTAQDKLGPLGDRLQLVFVTVDPERDTPTALGTYLIAISPKIIGLTGTPDQIASVTRDFRVYYGKRPTGNGANDYSVDHSSLLYLLSPKGDFMSLLNANMSPDDMAGKLREDMRGYS